MPNSGSLAVANSTSSAGKAPDLFPFKGLADRLLPMQRIRELYSRAQQPVNRSLLENVLSQMQVEYQVSNADLARIPASGPLLVVSNHPFGVLDGIILGVLLQSIRPDVKILTNSLLSGIAELHEHCFFVDPFEGREAVVRNRKSLKQALAWLRNGGMLAMFPAGEVSHLQLQKMQIEDPEWPASVSRMIRLTGSPVLPVYFRGCNGATFQTLGLIHPRLRTAWLLNEFLKQKGKKVEVRIGSVISKDNIEVLGNDEQTARYLRWRTYLLAQRQRSQAQIPFVFRSVLPAKAPAAIASETPREAMLQELENLPPERCLEENREFRVYLAEAPEVPNVIRELGRLREVTFRAVGEGTGKPRDLDDFDETYRHLLLWNKAKQEIAGSYRMGLTQEILPCLGIEGLYTSTLFKYDPRFFEALGPALELGRSFIRIEYQRQYTPLLIMWKGIGRYLVSIPQVPVLFGAVSISRRYHRASQDLIFRFFQSREGQNEFASLIKPRRPFRSAWIQPRDQAETCRLLQNLEQLADPISDIESDGKGVPILLRQYAKLGGRLLSFNVDRNFSNVLDGLVVVDLRKSDPAVLARFMGKEGLRQFRQYHGLETAILPAGE
ncbi:MAG: putative hemolysin [Acidobacteriaceae bacterium]|nr:putative hemolysin [Acidobacteriaceae bacterium]